MHDGTHMSLDQLTEAWTRQLVGALADELDARTRVALIDCPDHGNVGDSLIALGELRVLRLLGCRIVHISSAREDCVTALRALGPDVPILIHGGGNFGDLWPSHQTLRETLAREYRDRTVVQLSQSIHFRDGARAEQSAAALRQHPHFAVWCRDRESFDKAMALGLRARFVPDMALALGPLRRSTPPRYPVVVVRRTDHERADPGAQVAFPAGWHQHDWIGDVPGAGRQRARRAQARRWLPRAAATMLAERSLTRIFKARAAGGTDLVSSGAVVLTDRLHVHVLCTLCGIPHGFLDNNYGKVTSMWRAWTQPAGLARSFTSWDDAIAWAAVANVHDHGQTRPAGPSPASPQGA